MYNPRPPDIGAHWALFLDLDGTLLDIAPRPDAVVVADGLVDALAAAAGALDGALAIVTGRPVAVVDALLAPLAPPGGFGHGAELRLPDGSVTASPAALTLDEAEALRIEAAAKAWPGVILERKPHGLALHYRLAPEREADCRSLLEASAATQPGFALLPAHMAWELRPRGVTKAGPVEFLMAHPPFAGRTPVFVGDDVTDEDGMAAARRFGGLGLRVGEDFSGPAAVRAWLASGVRA